MARWGRGLLALALAGPALAAGPPEVYVVDASASRVHVLLGRAGLLKFLGHDHDIEAPLAGGRVEVPGGDVSRSSVRLRFEARSLAVVPGTEPAKDIPKVDARMRGPEVLDVERHPEIVFASSTVTGKETEPGHYQILVKGDLQLKGRSFPVEIPLDVRRTDSGIVARGEVEWRLRDLAIEPPSVAGVVNVADRFRMRFDITARSESPEPAAP